MSAATVPIASQESAAPTGCSGAQLWSDTELETRLCRVLDLAVKVLNQFGVDGFLDSESPVYAFGPEKVIAETAMLAYVTSGIASRPMIRDRLAELVHRLLPLARSERVLVEIALHPALATKFALPHVLLGRMGHGDRKFDEYLRNSLTASVRNGHDLTPTAAAEREWMCSDWRGNSQGQI